MSTKESKTGVPKRPRCQTAENNNLIAVKLLARASAPLLPARPTELRAPTNRSSRSNKHIPTPSKATMAPMMDIGYLEAEQPDGFNLLSHGHRDMVEASAFNHYGNRFATSSVDGKIKVYNRHRDGSWNLCDTWGAHTAEILQVNFKLLSGTMGVANMSRSNGFHPQSTQTSSHQLAPTGASNSG